jgi:hypothetical protein
MAGLRMPLSARFVESERNLVERNLEMFAFGMDGCMVFIMATVKAHFDGKVLVPEEPVNLPANGAVEVEVRPVGEKPLLALARQLEQLPDNADWPQDGASQHDHYLYGTPKQQ